jgi:hypothetical protein
MKDTFDTDHFHNTCEPVIIPCPGGTNILCADMNGIIYLFISNFRNVVLLDVRHWLKQRYTLSKRGKRV